MENAKCRMWEVTGNRRRETGDGCYRTEEMDVTRGRERVAVSYFVLLAGP